MAEWEGTAHLEGCAHLEGRARAVTERLDLYIAETLGEALGFHSRSQLKTRNLQARVNGREVKLSFPLKEGDTLQLTWEEAPPSELLAEDLPLNILYEDRRVLVLNKAQGMVVHPGAGNFQGTVANALLHRLKSRGTDPDSVQTLRPGIVHRLDKDTSGVLITALDEEALAYLSAQFKNRTVRKTYTALVQGAPPEKEGLINAPIGRDRLNRKLFVPRSDGKPALTAYRTLWTRSGYSLLRLHPRTGRTHQLRVHLKLIGCPILGDPLYGRPDKRFPAATLMLHASVLQIKIPCLKEGYPLIKSEERIFKAPLPQRFTDINESLSK
jgi:23S rRNA pseudouridine1911/1915/1917 synthase